MPAYIGQTATPCVDSKLITHAISANKVFPGQFVCLNELSGDIPDNFSVFEAEEPTASNIGEQTIAVVVNDGFETLLDGRRPAGDPNYFHYEIPSGECFTCVFVDNHLMYHIGMESIDADDREDTVMGKYLIPQAGSNFWAVSDTIPKNISCALKILAFRNLAVGGAEYTDSAPVAVCAGYAHKLGIGTDIISFRLADQVGDTVINGTQKAISMSVAGDITAQVADFELSPDATATVGGVLQVSGQTANDFSQAVKYTVTAGNGSTAVWTVSAAYARYSVTAITSDAHCTVALTDEDDNAVSVGIDNIHYNQQLSVKVTCDEGYVVKMLTLNGEPLAVNSTFTVTGHVSIEATSEEARGDK